MALAALVATIPLGGLVTIPLARAEILWPIYYGLGVLALALLWRSGLWRCLEGVLFFAFWAVLASWSGFALRISPDPALGALELRALFACAIVSTFVVVACRGSQSGVWALRAGWLLGMGATCVIGIWEILTRQHLWVTAAKPWPFGPGTVPAATFINPNNFSVALIGMLVAALATFASTRQTGLKLLAVVSGAVAVVLVAFTESRAGLLGLFVVFALEAYRRLTDAAQGSSPVSVLRSRLNARRGATVGVLAAAAAVVVTTFTVPALAVRNPLRTMLTDAFAEETIRSDSLRINLITTALGYLRDSHWLGTGAGSFEPILWNDPNSGIDVDTNLHNAFVELLSQYGVIVFLPLAALLLALAWRAARTVVVSSAEGSPNEPDPIAAMVHTQSGAATKAVLASEALTSSVVGAGVSTAHTAFGVPLAHELPTTAVAGSPQLPAEPASQRALPARRRVLGTELLGYLAAYVLLGITASSALAQQIWWLMLASCLTCAWQLHRARSH